MTPLQKVAMGLVLVLVDAFFGGYDAVPDPLGWALVIAGLVPLRADLSSGRLLVWLAGTCLVVALVTYPPQLTATLDDSTSWALSLPQLGFSYLLCVALAERAPALATRFRTLRWAFPALAAGPVLVLGGGLDPLAGPLAVAGVAATAYLVYLLFRADRAWLPAEAGTAEAGTAEPGTAEPGTAEAG